MKCLVIKDKLILPTDKICGIELMESYTNQSITNAGYSYTGDIKARICFNTTHMFYAVEYDSDEEAKKDFDAIRSALGYTREVPIEAGK